MERGYPLAVLIGTAEENPYWHKTFIENRSGAVESAREAVYKERPGRNVPDDAGVVELADARDSKSRGRKDGRVRPPPKAEGLAGRGSGGRVPPPALTTRMRTGEDRRASSEEKRDAWERERSE